MKEIRESKEVKEPKNRKEKAAATKKKIFDIAVRLVKEQGYHNVTISEICSAAGLAKGSFYVHYKSKEDIVRESYYTDMGAYVKDHFSDFTAQNPHSSHIDRIIYFLNLEFRFAEYMGYELTCLAYSLNLSACVPGPSEHFDKREFSKLLYDEVSLSMDAARSGLSRDDIFIYLESLVRGLMATWCFSNNAFRITERGKAYVAQAVDSVFE